MIEVTERIDPQIYWVVLRLQRMLEDAADGRPHKETVEIVVDGGRIRGMHRHEYEECPAFARKKGTC